MRPEHRNHFNTIRLLTAWAVIVAHHYSITGVTAPAWISNQWLNWAWLGGVAVMTFFVISGYLVTLSWMREPRLLPFLWKRVLRLWPGLCGTVLICIFVFGLAFTALPAPAYLTSASVLEFVGNLTLVRAATGLPGVFTGQPVAGTMNGPLWTIPLEFFSYCALAVAGLLGILHHRWVGSLLCAAYMLWYLLCKNDDVTGELVLWPMYTAYFAAGCLIGLHSQWFRQHASRLLMLLLPLCLLAYFLTPYQSTARFLLWPILIIAIGSRSAQRNWLHRIGDPSYGIYLYGFPVAQAVTALWPQLPFGINLAVTIATATALGCASWRYIESRALRYKSPSFLRKAAS
ncbi:peptidoglycan/LPS O-acetylase OafA/YrhL [Comamonas sp. BIGb0152]|nr:peptidoglycan/LPS O-acetylase OafA/YrhL [Comamonas sp. BIGb0152]